MLRNPLKKSKNVWQDLDEFNRNVLAGEYASSGNEHVLPPSEERNEETQGQKLCALKEENKYGTLDEIKICPPAEKDNVNEMIGKAGAQRGNLNKLPAIKEQPEGAVCMEEALPVNEEEGAIALLDDNTTNNMYPYSMEHCIALEQQCIITKQLFSKFVSEREKHKIMSLYSRPNSSVIICNSGASLHLSTRNQVWMEQYYGVPVLVVEFLDNSYNVFFLLAERGVGLPLWKDEMTWESVYTRETSTYHVMRVNGGRRQGEKMGLNFDLEEDATTFWLHLSRMITHLPGPDGAPESSPTDPGDVFHILSPEQFQWMVTDHNNNHDDNGNRDLE